MRTWTATFADGAVETAAHNDLQAASSWASDLVEQRGAALVSVALVEEAPVALESGLAKLVAGEPLTMDEALAVAGT